MLFDAIDAERSKTEKYKFTLIFLTIAFTFKIMIIKLITLNIIIRHTN